VSKGAPRPKGTGSVYQRQRDGRWCAELSVPGTTASGKRRRVIVTAPTKSAVQRRLRDKQRELEEAGATAGSRTTVAQWSTLWLDITATKLRPASWRANRSAVVRHIVPTIGHRRLADLTPGDIRAVTAAAIGAGLRDSSAQRIHRVLVGMLRAAVVEGYHVPQRVFLVDAPAATPGDRAAIPTADALRLLEVASLLPHGSRWAAALLNGLRQGEALGLTWECVDLDQGLMMLPWQLQPLTYADRERGTFQIPRGYEARRLTGAYHLVRPKSRAGWRVVPIVSWLADALSSWRLAGPSSPHDLVWPNLDGSPTSARADLDEWKAIQTTAEVGHPAGRFYGTHEARHTTATLLMELGVDPKVITAILGHSSIVVSRSYMHASQDAARAALEAVASRLALGPGPT
jgi:integrase